jgi:general secretion pathway protein J
MGILITRTTSRQRGFTLIELLVATSVFAVLGMLAYSGLNAVLLTRAHVTEEADRLKALQLSMSFMLRDIEQTVNRPVRDRYGDEHEALKLGAQPLISLTHAGWRNPAGLTRSQLQRVVYDIEDGELFRGVWTQLDGIDADNFLQTRLLDEVVEMEIRVLDESEQWHTDWPPTDSSTEEESTLPLAVEIKLTIEPWGTIRRLIALAR